MPTINVQFSISGGGWSSTSAPPYNKNVDLGVPPGKPSSECILNIYIYMYNTIWWLFFCIYTYIYIT